MGWLGFVLFAVATACGVIAVQHWRNTRIPVWQGMGLQFGTRSFVDLLIGITVGALAMGGIFIVEWVSGLLHVHGFQSPTLKWAIWILLLFLLAVSEEIAYRSLMLNGLQAMLRRNWLALIIMAACFGLAHAGNPNATFLSVLGNGLGGMMYGIAFLSSGRIWLPLGLHFAWNFLQGPVLGFPVSGLDMDKLVQQNVEGSELLTGGEYGPEAGLIGFLFRFVAIALLAGWFSYQSALGRRRKPNHDEA